MARYCAGLRPLSRFRHEGITSFVRRMPDDAADRPDGKAIARHRDGVVFMILREWWATLGIKIDLILDGRIRSFRSTCYGYLIL